MRSNLKCFGTTTTPPMRSGRRSNISPMMQDALFECLLSRPDMFYDEMAWLLSSEFDTHVSVDSVRNLLERESWTKKVIPRIAKERNADLRDDYHHQISAFEPEQLVFVDESGCDHRVGFRRTGWSPEGWTPVQVAPSTAALDGISCQHIRWRTSYLHGPTRAQRTRSGLKTSSGYFCAS
jgi:hypothetical protein